MVNIIFIYITFEWLYSLGYIFYGNNLGGFFFMVLDTRRRRYGGKGRKCWESNNNSNNNKVFFCFLRVGLLPQLPLRFAIVIVTMSTKT